jgi:two-component system NtrC family response regulator
MEGDSREPNHSSSRAVRSLPKLQDYRDKIYAQAEKEYLDELMLLTEKNIPDACRISGLSQSRLYALLKKYSISRSV